MFVNDVKNARRTAFERHGHFPSEQRLIQMIVKRTYAKLKPDTGTDDYLPSTEKTKDMTALAKILLPSYDFIIGKGRIQGLQERRMLCPFCENKMENE